MNFTGSALSLEILNEPEPSTDAHGRDSTLPSPVRAVSQPVVDNELGQRRGSGLKQILILRRTRIWFPAPTQGGSGQPLIPAPQTSAPSSILHRHTHIYTILKSNEIFKHSELNKNVVC